MAELRDVVIDRAKRFEYLMLRAYLDRPLGDPKAKWTLGYGFNLQRAGADEALARVGMRASDVWAEIKKSLRRGLIKVKVPGRPVDATRNEVVSEDNALRLLANDVDDALADCPNLVPNFDAMPFEAKCVLADMRFNMGAGQMREWARTLAAFQAGKFQQAANWIEAAPYARQVGKRAEENVQMLRRLANGVHDP